MSKILNEVVYEVDGGIVVLITATTVQEDGIDDGHLYEFVATDPCVCRWGTDAASAADSGFDFAVPAGFAIRARAPAGVGSIEVIEASAASAATAVLMISKIVPG